MLNKICHLIYAIYVCFNFIFRLLTTLYKVKKLLIWHTRDILQGTTCKLNFSNWIRGRRGAGFFFIATINFLSLKRFGLFNYEKGEIKTFKNFPCNAFARYPYVTQYYLAIHKLCKMQKIVKNF